MFYKLLWFFLECPNRGETYENKEQLRKVFIEQKQLELNPPKKTGARK